MTNLIIDLSDALDEFHPDDKVVVWSPVHREGARGQVVNTRPKRIPLAAGKAEEEVEPGPLMVKVQCMGLADTQEKEVVVPDQSSVTLWDLLEQDFTYTPPVISEVSEARVEVREAVARVGSAEQVGEWAERSETAASDALAIKNSIPATVQSEVDTRVPPKVAEVIGGDTVVRNAAAAAVSEVIDEVMPNKADTSYVDTADQALGKRITDEKWYRPRLTWANNLDDLSSPEDVGLYPVMGSTVGSPSGTPGWVTITHDPAASRTMQQFTPSSPTERYQMTRRFSGGAWSEWQVTSWRGNSIKSTTDLNNVTTPATYEVISTAAINLPVPHMGALEVLPASSGSEIIQRFTSAVDRKVHLRSFYLAEWSPWRVTGYAKGELGAADSLDTMNQPDDVGMWRALSTAQGLPMAVPGWVEILWERGASRAAQTFTPSTPANVGVSFRRVWANSAWTGWQQAGWGSTTITSSDDLNDYTTPGLFKIGSLYAANTPFPSISSLVVTNAGGSVIQTVTSTEHVPRTVTRTKTGDMWSSWVEQGRQVDRRMTWDAKTLESESWTTPAEISHGGKNWWNVRSYRLRLSQDEGKTWPTVLEIEGEGTEEIFALDNGEMLLVTDVHATRHRRVYISEGAATDPANATWRFCLESAAKHVKFPQGWSISNHDNIILLSEYGPKANGGWQGDWIEEGDNARYVYMSEDYGQTWRTIWDMNTWLASQGQGLDYQHPHGVAWDPWWERIWLTFGDNFGGLGSNGVLFSDDKGETWQKANFGSDPAGTGPLGKPQVVGITPMEKCILFVGDQYPSGFMRIDREGGKTRTNWTWHVAYQHWTGRHLGGRMAKRDLPNGEVVYVGMFTPEGVSTRSFIVATRDGYTFDVLWEDAQDTPVSTIGGGVVGPTLGGEMVGAVNNQQFPGKWTQLRGPVDLFSTDAATVGHLRSQVDTLSARVDELDPPAGAPEDTGWIDVSGTATSAITVGEGGYIRLRRRSHMIEVMLKNVTYNAGGNAFPLPASFRPPTPLIIATGFSPNHPSTMQAVVSSLNFQLWNGTVGTRLDGTTAGLYFTFPAP